MDPQYKKGAKAWRSNPDARPRLINIPPAETDRLLEIAKTEKVEVQDLLTEGLMRVFEDRQAEEPLAIPEEG